MFVSDAAIKSSSYDSLDRKQFSRYLGEEILKCQTKESLVIGILGEWGSGKTSIINMAIERIEYYSAHESKKPIIVKFNPWNYSEQNQLIYQFFNHLSLTLKMSNSSENLKKAGELLKLFGTVVSLGTLIPSVSQPSLLGSKILKSSVDAEKDVRGLLDKDLDGIKKQISDYLKKMNNKIIIVIDDIDRLSYKEIRQIFQLVKSLADFPNTIYILSFDRNIVIDALQDIQFHHGEKYLEKIVQVPIEIPLLSKKEIENKLFEYLSRLIESPINEIDKIHWADICQNGFTFFFKDMRDINRYINVMTFYFPLVKEEVNIFDFFAITALQVFFPDVYQKIRENKEILTGSITRLNDNERADYRVKFEEILSSVNEDGKAKELLKNYLIVLFPLSDSYEDSKRKNLRICSNEVFDTYFKFSLSNEGISQSEIRSILHSLNEPKNIFSKFNELRNNGKILTFLRIFPHYVDEIKNENIPDIVANLMNLGDLFPEDEIYWPWSDKYMVIRSCINPLLHKLEDPKEKFDVLRYSFNKSTKSIYTLVQELNFLEKSNKKYPNDKEDFFINTVIQDPIINKDELAELKRICIDKIKIWAKDDNKLNTHKEIFRIVKKWKDIEKEGSGLDNVIGRIINSDENLINFLSSSIFVPYSSSLKAAAENANAGYSPNIDLELIGNLIDLNKLKSRLTEIYTDKNFGFWAEREQKVIKMYLASLESIQKKQETKSESV